MTFEEPTLVLKYGSGVEATSESRAKLQEMRLSQSGIPEWEKVCLAYPALQAADVAFVSGSLTQGWGHANSDLDLFVVSSDPLNITDDSVEFFEESVACDVPQVWLAIGEIAQFRADIELWRTSQVEQLIGRFESETPNQEGAELGRTEKELLYRLSVALPLTGAEQWADWKRRIHASSFGLWLAENRKLSAEGMLEDAEGMLLSHDDESAVLAAREGYVLAVEAALAATGDYSSSRKWLHRRLVAGEDRIVDAARAWELLTMRGAIDAPAQWAREAADAAHALLLEIERRTNA